jgi:hypothetical protein
MSRQVETVIGDFQELKRLCKSEETSEAKKEATRSIVDQMSTLEEMVDEHIKLKSSQGIVRLEE